MTYKHRYKIREQPYAKYSIFALIGRLDSIDFEISSWRNLINSDKLKKAGKTVEVILETDEFLDETERINRHRGFSVEED